MGKNKKGKKKWHKRNETATKVTDVAHATHKQVLRGGPVSKMAAEDLFVVDTVKKVSRAQRKAMARERVLAVDKKVAPNPNVHAVGIKANKRPGTKGKGADRALLARTAAAKGNTQKGTKSTLHDPWAAEPEKKLDEVDPYLEGAARLVQGKGVPKRRGKARELPAVEVPHEGASYHPDPAAHQEALRLAVAQENERLRTQRSAWRRAPPRKVDASVVEKEEAFYRQGLFEEEEEGEDAEEKEEEEEEEAEAEVGEDEEAGKAAGRKLAEGERRTRQERARMAAEMAEVVRREATKRDKEVGKDIDNVRRIAREVRGDEAQREKRLIKRAELRAEREAKRTKKFGRLAHKPLDIAVPLTEELGGSMRTIKPIGTMLEDRQDSVRKRNLVEVTRKRKRRKVWRKVKEVGKQK